MHAIDIRKYEVGVDIGGPKGLVKLCPHCSKPGCRVGTYQDQPKVAHRVEVGWVKSTRNDKPVTVLKAKWSDVCTIAKKAKEERAAERARRKEEKRLEKLQERERAKAARKAERARLREQKRAQKEEELQKRILAEALAEEAAAARPQLRVVVP